MKNTKIEWCDCTINPVVGCTFGCPYCYARKMNTRFGWIPEFAKPQFFPERLKELNSKKPKIIFMNSMSDIADWKTPWIWETVKAMADNPQHIYLFLSKRLSNFLEMLYAMGEPFGRARNVLFGQSMTEQCERFWIEDRCDFLSIEPLLAPIDLDEAMFRFGDHSKFVRWVIIGAETGNRKEKVVPKKEWVDDIVNVCRFCNIPVFMKDSLMKRTDKRGQTVGVITPEEMLREFPSLFEIGEKR